MEQFAAASSMSASSVTPLMSMYLPQSGNPACAASAETASGLSPEISFRSTPSRLKYSSVVTASGLSLSAITMVPNHSMSGRGSSGCTASRVIPTSSTRLPSLRRSCTSPAAALPASFSGAPTTSVKPSKATALHLRSEEKGTAERAVKPFARVKRSFSARYVALLSCAPETKPAMSSSRSSFSPKSVGSTSSTSICPVVRVPVLSRQSVSTWARVSSAKSSCTSTRFFASAAMPTARLILMSSTSPLGSMPSSAAAVVTTAWFTASARRKYASRKRSTPRGGIKYAVKHVTRRME